MITAKDYLREIQKFTTSQYWNSGLRITAGVMVPLFFIAEAGWLSTAIPFLWGALFVSLTDTPGPIHHRRNGMIAAILLNTIVVLLTGWTKEYQFLLLLQLIVFSFILSLMTIYGARAGAVGSLALVIMLLNLLSSRGSHALHDSLLIAGGGTWYMVFSLLIYRLRPYRPVEQALGEYLTGIADFVRAKAAFYKEGADLQQCFHRLMDVQSEVLKVQDQTQELLFKTRKFVSDASPKSRSMMMIYLDSIDLFEQTLHAYQDYEMLHRSLGNTRLLSAFYGVILRLGAELEHIGIFVQTGLAVKKDLDLTAALDDVGEQLNVARQEPLAPEALQGVEALEKILQNIRAIANRINKLVLYTRLENASNATLFADAQQVSKQAVTQPITFQLMRENLSFRSNAFRYSVRLTSAMAVAYGISMVSSLTHPYWVLLTIVTIMKPVYSLTRKRNISRVGGTLVGVLAVSAILYLVDSRAVLLAIMVASMLIGYSLLRVNYFGFVIFLTVFVIITFHFLDPLQFKTLIRERLIDTLIGSVIAFVASRFLFPVWGHEEIRESMKKMLAASHHYLLSAWHALKTGNTETAEYESARQDAVVALTNLSDNFQRILAEPKQDTQSPAIHQFVIASHMLTGHIAALSVEKVPRERSAQAEQAVQSIVSLLKRSETQLDSSEEVVTSKPSTDVSLQSLTQLSMIYNLACDLQRITSRFGSTK